MIAAKANGPFFPGFRLFSDRSGDDKLRDSIAALGGPSNKQIPPDHQSAAMAKSGKRKKKVETIFLVCEETGDYNYTIRRKPGGEKLRLKRYSPRLRRHTLHVEKKK